MTSPNEGPRESLGESLGTSAEDPRILVASAGKVSSVPGFYELTLTRNDGKDVVFLLDVPMASDLGDRLTMTAIRMAHGAGAGDSERSPEKKESEP